MSVHQEEFKQIFCSGARKSQLLGYELIGSPQFALFEFVTNAYSAEANEFSVVLDLTGTESLRVSVEDNDDGIPLQRIQDIRPVLGSCHKRAQLIGPSGKKVSTHRQVD